MTSQTALFDDTSLYDRNGDALATLRARALICRACKLCETRRNVVFGTGCSDRPKVAFVGEGPGASEDAQGLPFVGASGQLLNRMIAKMGLDREKDCYVLNAVGCRPPDNRVPFPEEVIACRPFFHGQLRLIRPQTIITLGGTATSTLLGKQKSMKDFRGKWHKWEDIPVRPTFHPAYLLRNPKERSTTMIDLDAVVTFLRNGATNTSKRQD